MHGDTFTIQGLSGKKLLKGSIPVYGEKNTVLPAMAAATLFSGKSSFTNVPEIADVTAMAKLIEDLGGYVTRSGSELSVSAADISGTVFNSAVAKSMRASI